jgi:hypothetical protein
MPHMKPAGEYSTPYTHTRRGAGTPNTYGEKIEPTAYTYSNLGTRWGSPAELSADLVDVLESTRQRTRAVIRIRGSVDVRPTDRLADGLQVWQVDLVKRGNVETIVDVTEAVT